MQRGLSFFFIVGVGKVFWCCLRAIHAIAKTVFRLSNSSNLPPTRENRRGGSVNRGKTGSGSFDQRDAAVRRWAGPRGPPPPASLSPGVAHARPDILPSTRPQPDRQPGGPDSACQRGGPDRLKGAPRTPKRSRFSFLPFGNFFYCPKSPQNGGPVRCTEFSHEQKIGLVC